ncbi:hypothetical protein [Thiohalomonas denitrificans]|uniref:Uncharacterized protein n=1 Tax=Thiohalomonas denitrificans TaxID=415747 RepID=A0A1G5PSZ4_9GAMM|nr:hypothetical protein [Thiohalomonas denitrificans]SCZ52725.1 hypothetical protein SAMN03097708_00792 [Thiohalomonas denitrificans]
MEMTAERVDAKVMDVVTTAIEELGGPGETVRHHDQGILPALVESVYALILREELGQSNKAIAEFLGISIGAVESILAAPMESHEARLHYRADEMPEFDRHVDPDWSGRPETARLEPEYLAGAMAKFAYGVVQRRETRSH